jgi:hypothetical protein
VVARSARRLLEKCHAPGARRDPDMLVVLAGRPGNRGRRDAMICAIWDLALHVQKQSAMRRLVLLLVFTVIATGSARAEPGPPWGIPRAEPAPPSGATRADQTPPSTLDPDPGPGRPLAFGVNVPFAWAWSVALSVWVGLDDHHAIRANCARYRGPLWERLQGIPESEGPALGDIPPDFGYTADLSVGWVYYPRRALDGATLEASALLRINRLRDQIDEMNVASQERFTNVYGARALVGWTWRLSDWWFVALSVGASAGYERGREKGGASGTPRTSSGMGACRASRCRARHICASAWDSASSVCGCSRFAASATSHAYYV